MCRCRFQSVFGSDLPTIFQDLDSPSFPVSRDPFQQKTETLPPKDLNTLHQSRNRTLHLREQSLPLHMHRLPSALPKPRLPGTYSEHSSAGTDSLSSLITNGKTHLEVSISPFCINFAITRVCLKAIFPAISIRRLPPS